MLPYWIIFSVAAVGSLFEVDRFRINHSALSASFFAAIIVVMLLVGLRYEVGGDWNSYIGYLERAARMDFDQIPIGGDPGYVLLNWIVARLNGDIWWVNLACAVLFSIGLYAFCQIQPRPWLALLVAVPYLIVVVAMGYTRQAVAIGLTMLALRVLAARGSTIPFGAWIIAAATFHKTAVLLIPLAALAGNRGRLWTMAWVGAAAVGAYLVLLADSVDRLIEVYVVAEYDSSGAAVRTAMNALPALLFIVFRDRFPLLLQERRLWLILAVVALATVPALMLSPSSTAVDRLSLYLIPLQIMVLSRAPAAFSQSQGTRRFLTVVVVAYSAIALFVWLNVAQHSVHWIPYQLHPL